MKILSFLEKVSNTPYYGDYIDGFLLDQDGDLQKIVLTNNECSLSGLNQGGGMDVIKETTVFETRVSDHNVNQCQV
jgi:hypothetical protein